MESTMVVLGQRNMVNAKSFSVFGSIPQMHSCLYVPNAGLTTQMRAFI
jgi:hypothetical protein